MAVNGKSFLVDTTRCIGCRSCQVACKQWNELPAEQTVPTNAGTYENPPALTANTWLRIRFRETERTDGSVLWTFVRDGCRHCVDAPCKQAAQDPEAIIIDDVTGAVIHTEAALYEDVDRLRMACPYGNPREDADGYKAKCVMCRDRVHNGESPACVKACPTGGLTFGDRDEILDLADARVDVLREQYPEARLLDRRDVRVLILLAEPASAYSLPSG